VLYCSDGCRDSAWNLYHRVLCQGASVADPNHPTEKLKDAWRNMHYPPETSSIMLIARMIALVKQSDKKDQILSKFAEFCKSTVNEEEHIAHKLLGKEFQEQLEILRSLVCEAFYDEHVQQWFTPEGFRSLFALIGTNGQGVGTSSLSVWVHNCDALELSDEERQTLDAFIDQLYVDIEKESGTFLNCEGSGLYTFQSACNHSCQPNAEVTFPHNNFTLQMVAVQDIKAGEEICISYLDECDRERSRYSRQKALRENYLFNCNCSLCQSQIDDPDVTSEEEEEEEEEDEEQMQEDS
ncbi:SET and MYND domain-containing protein 5-like, partial [Lingula anatina]|uniref:Protein-lysine N-trimethyltransferase SMYD5 n=1 Tax=Lingula anatina TaxID=7574 RepID=A0A1S3HI53_LINAN